LAAFAPLVLFEKSLSLFKQDRVLQARKPLPGTIVPNVLDLRAPALPVRSFIGSLTAFSLRGYLSAGFILSNPKVASKKSRSASMRRILVLLVPLVYFLGH
jgi:hypothetical protein